MFKENQPQNKELKMCKETASIHSHSGFFLNSFLPFMVAYSQYSTVLGNRMMLYHHGKFISILCFSKFPCKRRSCKTVSSLAFLHHVHSVCPTLATETHIALFTVVWTSATYPCNTGTCTGYNTRCQVQSFLLETLLWRKLLWKAEFDPVAFA